ncbi:MAG: fibronectin type III domain-containing protein, partial [Bacteroidales bacterium]|nr:fibronectin type III domain-containing protein [Bacteroidales bacterium]
MLKHVQRLALLAAMMLLPWMGQAQTLDEYLLSVDSTTFTSIESTGTAITFSNSDDGYGTCEMPFAFPFGESMLAANNSVCVSSNGYIMLTGTSTSTTGSYTSSNYRVINPILAQDAHIGRYSNAGAYYQLDTTDEGVQCFTIEFHRLAAYSTPYGEYTCQVKFYESGDMEIIFDTVDYGGATSRTLRTYFWDGPNGDLAMLSGTWDNPVLGNTAATMPMSPAPTLGLRYTFTRPVITCPRPYGLAVSNIMGTSADLSWIESGTATSWVIEYDTAGFQLGTGNLVYASDTYESLVNLEPATNYWVYLHADCGGDTSFNLFTTFTTLCGDDLCPMTVVLSNHMYYEPWYDANLVVSQGDYQNAVLFKDNYEEDETFLVNVCPGEITLTFNDPYGDASSYTYGVQVTAPDGTTILNRYDVSSFSTLTDTVVCPDCLAPTNLRAIATTNVDSVTIAWHAWGEASQWEVAYSTSSSFVPDDDYTDGLVAYDTVFVLPTLNPAFYYYAFVRTDCGGSYSSWSSPITIVPGAYLCGVTGVDTLVTCGANIYDDGGATGNYSSNCNYTLVVRSASEDSTIVISGTVDGEGGYDELTVYDGVGTSGTIIYDGYTGSFGPVYSTGGAVTLHFSSDGSVQNTGFAVHVSCAYLSDCGTPYDLSVTNVIGDTVSLHWFDTTANTAWQIAYGHTGFNLDTVETNLIDVYDTAYTLTGLDLGTEYEFYVRGDCGSEQSFWAGPVTAMPGYFYSMQTSGVDTLHNACGYIITDDGGPNAPYSNSCSSTLVILPPDASSTLIISGNSYTEGSFDYIRIYDGIGTGGVQLWNDYNVSAHQTFGPFTSDAGAITVTFTSDGSVTYDGFQLAVSCVAASNCIRPNNLTVNGVTDVDVTLAWNERGDATQWQIEYGPAGFTPGTEAGTIEFANTNPYTIVGLTPNTQYDAYVQSDCGGELSTPTMISFRTACTPVDSLPYFYGFEDAVNGSNGHINSCWVKNSVNGGYPQASGNACTGSHSLYYDIYSYNGEHGYAAMPLINHQLDSLQVKFRMKRASSYNYSYYGYGMKVGVMTDPYDLNTFEEVATFTATSSTDWDTFTCFMAGYTGQGRYIAFMDAGNNIQYYTYLYLDDVEVDFAPECGPVENIVAETTPFNALISWTPSSVGEYNGAIVVVEDPTDNTTLTDTVMGNTATFTGLTPDHEYNVSIISTCVDGMSVEATSSFRTAIQRCGAMVAGTADTAAMGTGTSQTSGVPVNSGWGNTVCQSIFTAAELHAAGIDSGTFNAIDFTWTTSSSYAKEFTIIMGSVASSTTSYGSTSDMVGLASHVVAYTGVHPIGTTGTVHYDLDAPFNWNGTDNVVLTTFMNQPAGQSHTSSGFYGLSTNTSSNTTTYAYQDYNPFTVANATTSGNHYLSNYRPTVTFYTGQCGELESCIAPAPVVTEVSTSTATVSWAPGNVETSWNVYAKLHSNRNYTYYGTATTNNYTISGLIPGSNYDFMVVALCGDDSNSAVCSATTECAMISSFPYIEDFNSWGSGSGIIPNCWNTEGSYSTYPYLSTSYNASGAGSSMYFYLYNNGSNYVRATMPAVDTTVMPIRNLQVYFQAMNGTTSYVNQIEVGVMTNPNNINTYVPVSTVDLSSNPTGVWYDYEVPLTNYTDTGAYITFKAVTSSGYTYSYIDDVTIEEIPTCQRPDSLVLDTVTTSSFTCHWHERGEATNWVIEYGPRGFQPGTGVQVPASTNPFTVTGVPSAYVGEFYVYSVCSSSDMSPASRHAAMFATAQIPATVPYSYDFEDSTEFANWQTSTNNNDVNWYRGSLDAYSGSNSMYVSADNGATISTNMNAIINSAIYRDIDFGSIDSTFEISFRYRCGGTTANRYDGLMVFLVDPTMPVVPSNAGITSPWGNVNDLYRIANLRCDTTWRTFHGSFDTIHGVQRVAFFWFNQSTGDAGFEWGPCAVDDITVNYSPCPRPLNLDVDVENIGSTTARLVWDGPSSATYRVAYRVAGAPASTNMFALSTTNNITLTGLDPMTTYNAWVQKICGSDSSLFSDGVGFVTNMCESATYFYNYDSTMSTATTYYAPIGYATYNYSYVQTIIDSAYLAGLDGDITAMSFHSADGTAGTYFTNMDIYMANTSATNLASGFIMPDTGWVQLTNGADLSYSDAGWHVVGFDTQFTWDGHSNVLLSVNRRHGSWTSSGQFYAHNTSDVKTRYIYEDVAAYNPSTVTGGYTLNLTGDIELISCGGGRCNAPVITSVAQTYHDVALTWAGNGTDYEVNIKEAAAATWPDDIAVTGNTYTFSGLNPATYYTLRVRQDCNADSMGYSAWTETTFMTDSLPCLTPSALVASNVTNAEATIDWTVNGNETNWDIHVWFAGGFDSIYRVSAHPAIVSGFTAGVTYNVAVRALCGVGLVEGDWSDAITFTTATCPDVTGLATSNVTTNSID